MTIHYNHQQIWTSQRVHVTGTGEAERDAVEAHLRSLGYQRKLWVTGDDGWEMRFVRTEVVADTSRGDKVALDGRWEVGR